MKLPIQKTQRRQEPMRQESEMWPMALSLFERYFPEEWTRSLSNLERNTFREMETWMPRVDIAENDKELILTADVPGVKPEDIKVEISGDNMIISGQSEEEKEEQGKTWHRMERRSGRFYREFLIPGSVDRDKIEATSDNGMLSVRLPKKPESISRNIEVKKVSQGVSGQQQGMGQTENVQGAAGQGGGQMPGSQPPAGGQGMGQSNYQ
jgi:HSP20 family protein